MFGHPCIWKNVFLYLIHRFLSYHHAPLGTVCPHLFYSCPLDSSIHPWALWEWRNSLHSASPVTCFTMLMFFLAKRPKQGMIPIYRPTGTKQKGWVNSTACWLLSCWQPGKQLGFFAIPNPSSTRTPRFFLIRFFLGCWPQSVLLYSVALAQIQGKVICPCRHANTFHEFPVRLLVQPVLLSLSSLSSSISDTHMIWYCSHTEHNCPGNLSDPLCQSLRDATGIQLPGKSYVTDYYHWASWSCFLST